MFTPTPDTISKEQLDSVFRRDYAKLVCSRRRRAVSAKMAKAALVSFTVTAIVIIAGAAF